MKVSTKGKYGLRALVDLAIHSKTDHVALVSIAQRQGISVQYLEQVFASLRKAGILKSVKGPKGGYTLGIKAEALTAADVLRVLEGELTLVDSLKTDNEGKPCAIDTAVLNVLWVPLDDMTLRHLQSVTIADLVAEVKTLEPEEPEMFYI